MELIIYIIIAIIWGIVTLIQKASKTGQTNKKRYSNTTQKNKSYKKNTNNNEEEIFKRLQKNISDLKNINEETLRKNTINEDVYVSNYTASNNDREMLELQQRYNSKLAQINSIREDTNNDFDTKISSDNKKQVNQMLSSLDIKNAIIYNAILEPKRIHYTRVRNSKIN